MTNASISNPLPADFPDDLARDLMSCLDWLAEYRANIQRGRDLDRRFGGEGRYVDDMRNGAKKGLRTVAEEVRTFVRLGREIGEDPIGILRTLEAMRGRS